MVKISWGVFPWWGEVDGDRLGEGGSEGWKNGIERFSGYQEGVSGMGTSPSEARGLRFRSPLTVLR